MINKLKISAVALMIGAGFMACSPQEECFECTASDMNGQAASMSDEICADNLSQDDKDAFRVTFTALHNPAAYNISCADK
ncbi:MAG: hypothetical protein ACPGU4_07950 [Flavobacteriales bacterium]